MQPTMKFRWLEVHGNNGLLEHPSGEWKDDSLWLRVLQQWWAVWREGKETPEGEWRDVPMVKA